MLKAEFDGVGLRGGMGNLWGNLYTLAEWMQVDGNQLDSCGICAFGMNLVGFFYTFRSSDGLVV
jgi:hypothetical protein